MNYYLIKNNHKIMKYEYPDIFDVVIYYIDNNECQINVKRLDSNVGWGLLLEIKIYDIYNDNYEIITFGNSDDNFKILYFTTNIELLIDENSKINIPNILLPRKEYLIKNEYKLIKETENFIDFNIVIYYLNDNKIKIIIRRLDDYCGWDINMKLILYDNIVKNRKEIINIIPCKNNFKYLFIKTKLKISFYDHEYNQEIPKIIFQTGYSTNFKNILHFNSIISFIELNPEYTYIYYDNKKSRKFLKENFSDEINYSYDLLVPGAFKADLLRYCFLYNNGGCYFDCKQILRIPIRNFLKHDKKIILCNDAIDNALLNAVIFSTIKNEIIEKTIKDCVYSIINKLGTNALSITGPIFFYNSIKDYINNDNLIFQNHRPIDNYYDFSSDYYNNNIKMIENNTIILNRFYKEYYNNYLDKNHYGKLFDHNEIYYKNFQISDDCKICVYPNNYNDKFLFEKKNKTLMIKRIDTNDGWYFNLKILIIDKNLDENLLEIGMSKENIKYININ
jgi:mannosyltransferase OCH1-like enzyme